MQSLLKRGFSPTSHSVNHLLSSLLRCGKYQLLLHVVSQVTSNTKFEDSLSNNLIIRALLKTGKYYEAENRLSRESPNSLWNALICGVCVLEKDPERAFSLLMNYLNDENSSKLLLRNAFRTLVFSFCSVGRMDRAIEVVKIMTSISNGYSLDNYVSSSIISGFCKMGRPELGLEFFEKAKNCETFVPNLVTYTCVVDALLRCKQTKEASDLVMEIEAKGLATDAFFYGCWASGCLRNFDLVGALEKHKLMAEKKITPDVVNYSIFVNGFCKEVSVEKAIGILELMNVKGTDPNLITYTSVLQGFCKKGKLKEATALMRKLQELGVPLDEFAYSTLINGWCHEGDLEMVFKFLDEMEEKGIEIGAVTLNTVINGLCKVGDTKKANQLLNSLDDDVTALSTMLCAYLREMNGASILNIVQKMEANKASLDIVGCNILIRAYFFLGMFEDALLLFRSMPALGLTANSNTRVSIINVCFKLGMIDEALEIIDEYASMGSECDLDSLGGMIVVFCKCGMLEAATEVFQRLSSRGLLLDPRIHRMLIKINYDHDQSAGVLKFMGSLDVIAEPNLVSLVVNDAIVFLCRKRCRDAVKELFILAKRKNWGITLKSYFLLVKFLLRNDQIDLVSIVVSTCIKEYGIADPKVINTLAVFSFKKDAEKALQFLKLMIKREFSCSVSTGIIESLKREGRTEDAYQLVMEARENGLTMDLVTYSIIIDGLSKEGRLEKALMLCSKMKDEGVKPNIFIFNSILNGLCQQGCLVEAMRIFDALGPSNVVPSVVTYDTLIHGLVTQGHLEKARNLFEEMISSGLNPNLRVYNTMINGYCSWGSVGEAMNLLLRLEESSMNPDSFTVSSLVNGYCMIGDVEGALECYTEQKKRGITLDFLGFFHLIEGLLSKGRMEEARSILWDMLQCPTIIDILSEMEIQIEGGSLLGDLIVLSEDGRINDAIMVLAEVGLLKFSGGRFISNCRSAALRRGHKRNKYFYTGNKFVDLSREKDNSSRFCELEVGSTHHKTWNIEDLLPESKVLDFDVYYPLIASLCRSGELQKASSALKYVMTNSRKHL